MGGERGDHDAVAEFGKEGRPEGVVLVNIQHARDTDSSAESCLFGEGLVCEDPPEFVFVKVRDIVLFDLLAEAAFTAVAGDIFAPAAEVVDCQAAVVVALSAVADRGLKGQLRDLVKREHSAGGLAVVTLSGDQSRAESAHDAGDIGTDDLSVRDQLQAAQDSVIIEGAALYDDVAPQLGRIGYLDNLEKRVLDDRVSKAG